MKIVALEIAHDRFSIDIREKLAFSDSQLLSLLAGLKNYVEEVFVLSTCNRWAIYAYVENFETLDGFFDQFPHIKNNAKLYLTTEQTVQHLFATAAGLNSQVVGEHEILGQIKHAKKLAQEADSIGPILDECLREAIRVGKLVRNQTEIGRNSTSIASVAVNLISDHFETLSDKRVLVIGTGRMAQNSLNILYKRKISQIYVASHSMFRAKEMAAKYRAYPILINQIDLVLGTVDVVIGGTQKPVNMWDKVLLGSEVCPRDNLSVPNGRPRLFIDLGMPRNFNPNLKKMEGVELFDLDDIKSKTVDGMEKRLELLPDAWAIIKREVESYKRILSNRKISEIYAAYWQNLERHKSNSLLWLKPKLGDVTDDQWELLERWAHKMIRSISKGPFCSMRNMVEENHLGQREIEVLKSLNGIESIENENSDELCKLKSINTNLKYKPLVKRYESWHQDPQ